MDGGLEASAEDLLILLTFIFIEGLSRQPCVINKTNSEGFIEIYYELLEQAL